MTDKEKAAEQLGKVEEAMNTVRILNTLESRYELSLEILKLGELVPLRQDKVNKMREEFGLISAVWILAELEIEKIREGK